jgi:hypothetical protein
MWQDDNCYFYYLHYVCLGLGRSHCGCNIQQVLHKRAKRQDVIIWVILSKIVSSQYMYMLYIDCCSAAGILMYTLWNKNASTWNFLSPELEVTWCTVAIVIRVILLTPYLCIHGVPSLFHSVQSIKPHIYEPKTIIHSLNLKLKHYLNFIYFPWR